MEDILIIGCGGHAKSVCDSIIGCSNYHVAGFIDCTKNEQFIYRNSFCIGSDDDLERLFQSGIRNAFVGIGYLGKSDIRQKIYERLLKIGYTLPIIIDSTAIISEDVVLGEGTFIGKGAIVNTGVKVDYMSIINSGSIIEHDCVIGAYSHVAVGACLCGNVVIGKNCFIGANATVIQDKMIGSNTIIGAGTVIYSNIDKNMKVVNERVYHKSEINQT